MQLTDLAPYVVADECAKTASPEKRPKRVLRAHLPKIGALLWRMVVRLN